MYGMTSNCHPGAGSSSAATPIDADTRSASPAIAILVLPRIITPASGTGTRTSTRPTDRSVAPPIVALALHVLPAHHREAVERSARSSTTGERSPDETRLPAPPLSPRHVGVPDRAALSACYGASRHAVKSPLPRGRSEP